MGGHYISCGKFRGEDKSGSAFQEVLQSLADAPADLIANIVSEFDEEGYVEIKAKHAKLLLPLLRKYRRELVKKIGHDDWMKALQAEEASLKRDKNKKRVQGKYGESPAWQLYCTTDLIEACKTAVKDNEKVLIMYM